MSFVLKSTVFWALGPYMYVHVFNEQEEMELVHRHGRFTNCWFHIRGGCGTGRSFSDSWVGTVCLIILCVNNYIMCELLNKYEYFRVSMKILKYNYRLPSLPRHQRKQTKSHIVYCVGFRFWCKKNRFLLCTLYCIYVYYAAIEVTANHVSISKYSSFCGIERSWNLQHTWNVIMSSITILMSQSWWNLHISTT